MSYEIAQQHIATARRTISPRLNLSNLGLTELPPEIFEKKGLIKGLVNTALDATPFVGVAKNAIELITGDWVADKPGQETRAIQADLNSSAGQRKQVAA